jgi:hypothetical protein
MIADYHGGAEGATAVFPGCRRRRGRRSDACGSKRSILVIAGLPGDPDSVARPCLDERDGRVKPGHDESKRLRVKSAYSDNGHALSVIAFGFPTLRRNDRTRATAGIPS